MPEIRIKHIVSFSSEDKVHKAENLLKPETYRKWKCATLGEKKATIVLQFEKATQINSIDIGNENSAFVEVLVGRSSDPSQEFKVLLVASSFMSPLESRNETNTNRVRMFGQDKLSQSLKDEKWDTVQIVCTQPFSKHVQYGLTFIKFHSPPDPSEQLQDEAKLEPELRLGAFKLKAEVDDEESSLTVGKLFMKRKEKASEGSITSPVAIRKASSFAEASLASINKPPVNSVPVQRRKDDVDAASRASPLQKKESAVTRVDRDKVGYKNPLGSGSPGQKPMPKTVKPKPAVQESESSRKVAPVKAKEGMHKKLRKKPFSKIMEKVVFVLSGFQNPLRSDIRDSAVEMGAKYKGDWDPSCTHLVCAFVNTPKYLQVLAQNGRIVTKDWIFQCQKKKELLPWRSHMLGKYTKETTSEEESSEDDASATAIPKRRKEDREAPDEPSSSKKLANSSLNSSPKKEFSAPKNEHSNDDQTDNDDDDDEAAKEDYLAATDADSSSGGDTEDEIRKVQKRKTQNSPSKVTKVAKTDKNSESMNGSVHDDSADSFLESSKPNTEDLPLPELPNFFKDRYFFLFGDFSEKERHDLVRFIVAYKGHVAEYMDENVKYVIAKSKWNKHFEEALNENDNLIFVRPHWIHKCHQSEKFIPFQPYIIVPGI